VPDLRTDLARMLRPKVRAGAEHYSVSGTALGCPLVRREHHDGSLLVTLTMYRF